MRAAVIGCGAAGGAARTTHPDVGIATHAAAYAACEATELVAACDLDEQRARDCATRAYTAAAALLDREAPEVVSVATPDDTHATVVEACLRTDSVRAVLAEKPLALTTRDAAALVALARERGIALAVNYTRRFAPAFRALHAPGDLQHVAGTYTGGLLHNGTHWLDLLRMLAGEPEVVAVHDDVAVLTLPGGATAQLTALDARHFDSFEMQLTYTRGRIRIAQSGHLIERWTVADDPLHPGYRTLRAQPPTTAALRDATLHAVADLVGAVRERREPACTGEDGVAAIRLAEAVYAAGYERFAGRPRPG